MAADKARDELRAMIREEMTATLGDWATAERSTRTQPPAPDAPPADPPADAPADPPAKRGGLLGFLDEVFS